MIPQDRPVITIDELARLHHLTAGQVRRHQPWLKPDHPAPLPSGGPRWRPVFWDRQQAVAYARGEDVPPLPRGKHRNDLLDRVEAAELAGVNPVAWRRYMHRELVPPPDRVLHGRPYWYRSTVARYAKERRKGRRRGGGRPPGSPAADHDEVRRRVTELLEQDPTVSIAEIARTLRVAYSTAHKHVKAVRDSTQETEEHSRDVEVLTNHVTDVNHADAWFDWVARHHQLVGTSMTEVGGGWKLTARVAKKKPNSPRR